MPSFSKKSLEKLNTCHPNLIFLMNEVIKYYDFTVLCGTRSDSEQNQLYKDGKSKKKAGESKHNQNPSLAIDIAPWFNKAPHIDWEAIPDFAYLQGFIHATAIRLGVGIRLGSRWDHSKIRENSFKDYVHIELIPDKYRCLL